MVCPSLRNTGTCPKDQCRFSHFLKFCELCNVVIESSAVYDAHHRTREHSRRTYHAGKASNGVCPLCLTGYTKPRTVQSFYEHCQTTTHGQAARLAGLNSLADRFDATAPAHSQSCTVCRAIIPNPNWDDHIASGKHAAAKLFHATKSSYDSQGRNKCDVEVSGGETKGFDFDVIAQGSGRHSISVDLELTSDASISVVDIRLVSGTGPVRYRTKSQFVAPTWRGRLNKGITKSLEVHFESNQLGRFEDRIEFVFRDNHRSTEFSIFRTLHAVVALDPAELKALGPIAPYERPKRQTVVDAEPNDIEGVKPFFDSDIQWKTTLPIASVPKHIQQAVLKGTFDEQLRYARSHIIPPNLTIESYVRYWTSLLHLEELRMAADLAAYDMFGQTLQSAGNAYKLRVPGLAEKRPSVVLGDRIRVRPVGSQGAFYAGFVHDVEQSSVTLRFHAKFKPLNGQKFDVRFTLGRTTLRRMHQALLLPVNSKRIIFPSEEHFSEVDESVIGQLNFVNDQLKQNLEQSLAVASILSQKAGSGPFVVFGPPGTGKTTVIVEAIRQLMRRDSSATILACAPSNSAADLIAQSLKQKGANKSEILRLNAPSRLISTLPKELVEFSRQRGANFAVPKLAEIVTFRVVIATCSSAALPHGLGVARGHFTHIFIDEAGQAMEPEAMIAIRTMAGARTNIVLSGDPMQLGLIIHSDIAAECGLGISYLDRIMQLPAYDVETGRGRSVVKLLNNYRSHQAILQYPNQIFYDGELKAFATPDPKLVNFFDLPMRGFPIIFHGVSGEDMREATSPSFFNPIEASIVKDYVQKLREDQKLGIRDSDIGVIAPYNAQNRKIRTLVNDPKLKGKRQGVLKVGSVEEFQGQERKVIIVSTVRSNTNFIQYDLRHTLGFVANPRRFNVAMTRAQSLLIVIGDPVVLSLDPMWREFLEYIDVLGGWRGKPRDWDDDVSSQGRDLLTERKEAGVANMDDIAQRMRQQVVASAPTHANDPRLNDSLPRDNIRDREE
ncbi:P-loop containing nucleoside triphosphate hydrolase protein [Clavulina sp. PMI_390]|nr:P-loop containing nucleoside triphosphate hydrolase protein [Clavulina sp. PMI_390]